MDAQNDQPIRTVAVLIDALGQTRIWREVGGDRSRPAQWRRRGELPDSSSVRWQLLRMARADGLDVDEDWLLGAKSEAA